MSRENLLNSTADLRSGTRILTLLKTRGSQTAQEIGRVLGTTGEAARQQLVKLATQGLVEMSSEARGVGRPAQYWHLTAAGNARFPDAHADLTAQLIGTIRRELGEGAMDKLISVRAEETHTSYAQQMAGADSLQQRVVRLADIRTREGYMAEWEKQDDKYFLIENHCPICVAATACAGFCRAEINLFQEVLGPEVRVERTEHIVSGARRCVYRIEAAPDS
jgi:predicted ArsR family transcriptional regulator